MKVLIACEFSGIVREAFAKRGHDAWSCDLLPTEIPGKHIQDNVLNHLDKRWDLMIAHPPCTYLSNAGAGWDKRKPERIPKRKAAAKFFKQLLDAPIPMIAIENPVMLGRAKVLIGRNYDQIVEPFHFGHPFRKKTCLWLKGLPKLKPTKIVQPTGYWVNSSSNYRNGAKLSNKGLHRNWKDRSRTFKGIAEAMAKQWGKKQGGEK